MPEMIERDGMPIGVFPDGPWLPRATVDVEHALGILRELVDDPESAHIAEKQLWRGVLLSIAVGLAGNAADMAKLAVESQDIDFPRWYA